MKLLQNHTEIDSQVRMFTVIIDPGQCKSDTVVVIRE